MRCEQFKVAHRKKLCKIEVKHATKQLLATPQDLETILGENILTSSLLTLGSSIRNPISLFLRRSSFYGATPIFLFFSARQPFMLNMALRLRVSADHRGE